MMQEVAIVGIGQTPVEENWEKSLKDIAGEAAILAINDSGAPAIDAIYIGNMLSGILTRQEQLGTMLADWLGQKWVESIKIEAACGSGAAALRMGIMAITSGEINSAVVIGVEKMSETTGTDTTSALATAADSDYEVAHGLSFVGINALVMRRYLEEYGWDHSDFAPFPINAHNNAIDNPNARLRERIDLKGYQNARMVADPINLYDASPTGDGAAAVVIVAADQVIRKNKIVVMGSASATDALSLHDRKDALWLAAAEKSAKTAMAQASVTLDEIDLFELHDAFSIMAVLSLEACGFAERGRGPVLGLENQISTTGKIPISTMGGLKARGHPVGATGIYQIVELVQQLRGEAGSSQVDGARIGLAQNIGGSGATILTHIVGIR